MRQVPNYFERSAPGRDLVLRYHNMSLPEGSPADDCAPALAALTAALDFIDAAPGAVLVHCALGVSRSATVAAAQLIRGSGCSVAAAVAAVREARPVARPDHRKYHGVLEALAATRTKRAGGAGTVSAAGTAA